MMESYWFVTELVASSIGAKPVAVDEEDVPDPVVEDDVPADPAEASGVVASPVVSSVAAGASGSGGASEHPHVSGGHPADSMQLVQSARQMAFFDSRSIALMAAASALHRIAASVSVVSLQPSTAFSHVVLTSSIASFTHSV